MVDLEFIANRLIGDREAAKRKLVEEYVFVKGFEPGVAAAFAQAVLEEVENSRRDPENPLVREVLKAHCTGVGAGVFGVGSRGEGDFFVHSLIAQIAHTANKRSNLRVVLEPIDRDDVGGVEYAGGIVVGSIDGAHSRLSGFPFLMGFHAARAALRDVCVKGAIPLFLMDDVHLADDGDVAKIFEFVAGVAAVAEISGVPLVCGSTLRVGGDMVLGDRLVGAVGCVGFSDGRVALKAGVRTGDLVVMTEGSGGGTISTTAIYSGRPDVVVETLNLDFYFAVKALREAGLLERLHGLTDVTNGGLRGDLENIAKTRSVSIVLDAGKFGSLINPRVREMLEELGVDPLGLSLDSLLIFTPKRLARRVVEVLGSVGVRADVVGRVERGEGCYIEEGGVRKPLAPLFRESPYTKLKKLVGTGSPERRKEMAALLEEAARSAVAKKELVVKSVLKRYS